VRVEVGQEGRGQLLLAGSKGNVTADTERLGNGALLHLPADDVADDVADGVAATGTALLHLAAVVDGGPGLISWHSNGALLDGGEERLFGWGFFKTGTVGSLQATKVAECQVGASARLVRVYGRVLTTSELVANYRAGPSPGHHRRGGHVY